MDCFVLITYTMCDIVVQTVIVNLISVSCLEQARKEYFISPWLHCSVSRLPSHLASVIPRPIEIIGPSSRWVPEYPQREHQYPHGQQRCVSGEYAVCV